MLKRAYIEASETSDEHTTTFANKTQQAHPLRMSRKYVARPKASALLMKLIVLYEASLALTYTWHCLWVRYERRREILAWSELCLQVWKSNPNIPQRCFVFLSVNELKMVMTWAQTHIQIRSLCDFITKVNKICIDLFLLCRWNLIY